MTEKATKASVNYGPAKATSPERCGNCAHFLRREEACDLVQGYIGARDWCRLWEAKSGR